MTVYFDLNIFDRIEKKASLPKPDEELYTELEDLVLNKKITVPYSNAHLNDLSRGYKKNPKYVKGHLDYIEKLSNNLCICQYWNRKEATWHYRNIHEFFESLLSEFDVMSGSFVDLMEFDDLDVPNPTKLLKYIPLPDNWNQLYKVDPIFEIMFPRSKTEQNKLALTEDIFDFQKRLKSDYGLYKKFRAYLIKSSNVLRDNGKFYKSLGINLREKPKHLDFIDLLDEYTPNTKTSENKKYSKIMDVFYKHDLKGYKSDGKYSNMIDDSLHTFYGAHCDFFITNDDKCKYKAEKTYERLKINTRVIDASQIDKLKKAYNTI